ADGSVAIVGLTGDPGPFDYYPNTYVARVASDGAMLWDTIYGLPEGDTGYDIEILPDGGYLIAGSYWRSLSSTRDVYVVRTLPDPMAIESREPLAMATHFALTAYPNPFNAVCRLSLELDQPGHVNLDVFDLTGRLVKQLVNARLNRGSHSLVLDGSVLPTGVYFVQARVGNRQETLKLLLLR
ncbi:MAG: T9SS type A sorting domain-containing protein, partial [Calditrichota bacterium]